MFLKLIIRFLKRLRFPYLFVIGIILLAINALVPDPVPFVDEILLVIGTLLLASLKKTSSERKDKSRQIDSRDDTGT